MQRSRGSDMRARESASICCSPPESVPAGWVARLAQAGKACHGALDEPVHFVSVLAIFEAAHLEILAHGERRKHAPALGHQRDAGRGAGMGWQPRNVDSIKKNLSLSGKHRPCNAAHGGALAGAVRADQG